jgi:hypothetical protein
MSPKNWYCKRRDLYRRLKRAVTSRCSKRYHSSLILSGSVRSSQFLRVDVGILRWSLPRNRLGICSESVVVGPVGFEPTTSAESFVYGYLHALRNFLIPPRVASAYPNLDSGARRHSFLGPDLWSGLARLRPLDYARRLWPAPGRPSKIVSIKILATLGWSTSSREYGRA